MSLNLCRIKELRRLAKKIEDEENGVDNNEENEEGEAERKRNEKETEKIMNQSRWKKCPKCKSLLEKNYGIKF